MGEFDKGQTESNINTKPTTMMLQQQIERMIESRRASKIHQPFGMPPDPNDAAKWFLILVEGQKRNEGRVERSTKRGKTYWAWPYADRVKYLLKLFYAQTPEMQSLIVAARQDRIAWRGDTMKTFAHIINEIEQMRRMGMEAYRIDSRRRRREDAAKISEKGKEPKQDIEANRKKAMQHTGIE